MTDHNRFAAFAVYRWRMARTRAAEWGDVRTDMHTCAAIMGPWEADPNLYDATDAALLAEIAHIYAMENRR